MKIVQQESFHEGDFKHRLKSLHSFLDEEGMVRLKMKVISHSDDDHCMYPIVLPSRHKVVERLIRQRHLMLSHAGVQTVLAHLRRQFWIVRGRKTVQRVISKCVRCRRYAAKGFETLRQPYPTIEPETRQSSKSRELTWQDRCILRIGKKPGFYCSPALFIGRYTSSSYRVFPHLSDGFMSGFRRFVARRGRPRIVYSDNGTNFTGTNNILKALNWEKIVRETSVHRIQWKFNPPAAAWWGRG